MSKINTEVLDTFMKRTRQASATGSKEMRLSMAEAVELMASIGQLMARNIDLAEDIRELEALFSKSVNIDGGGFK